MRLMRISFCDAIQVNSGATNLIAAPARITWAGGLFGLIRYLPQTDARRQGDEVLWSQPRVASGAPWQPGQTVC
jgi:hypothetical protein